jgi:dolichol-phosphate mannosyltransferase
MQGPPAEDWGTRDRRGAGLETDRQTGGPVSAASPSLARPTLSVVAPAFNESESIEEFVHETCRKLNGLEAPYELICVDDGSTDDTWEKLTRLCHQHPALRPAALEKHCGQSAAVAAGTAVARGDVIAYIDADLQNDPADIERMYRMLCERPEYACIMGLRTHRQDDWLRRISSRIANWAAQQITGDEARDAACGLKLCRGDCARRLPYFRGAHRFISALVKMDGGRVLETAVNHRPRLRGHSKYGSGLGRTFVALRDALGVRWMRDRKIQYVLKTPEGYR